jgi:hypothetical protein
MRYLLGLAALALVAQTAVAQGLEADRLRVQRKEVFEFTEPPSVSRSGDRVTITFAVKDYCDATVAIEDDEGRILRYLASGVLGANAPEPFEKDSLRQALIWDSKDEQGRYVADGTHLKVRVSLGLRARMERTLQWSPHRMAGGNYALMRSAPEGMYVLYRGLATQLLLLNHHGDYIRTVYPFPRDKIEQVNGLKWQKFPPDNERLPSKIGTHDQMSFLPDFSADGEHLYTMAMDVRGDRICLAGGRLILLSTDGSTGGMELTGPKTSYVVGTPQSKKYYVYLPNSVALSPDGNRAYLTGYMCHFRKSHFPPHRSWYHLVNVVDLRTGKITRFAGTVEAQANREPANNTQFRCPMSVACDAKGRVYVADNFNNRIQVYQPDGTYFRSIPVKRPGIVRVNPKNGDIYVRSSDLAIVGGHEGKFGGHRWGNHERHISKTAPPRLSIFGPVENPKRKASYEVKTSYGWQRKARCYDEQVEIDFHADTPTFWMSHVWAGKKYHTHCAIRMYRPDGNKLVNYRHFDREARKVLVRTRPWRFARPRMAVSPTTGLLYVAPLQWQAATYDPCFNEVIVVDPKTGKHQVHALPTDPEDMTFDAEGRIYLRTFNAIARFDPETWREIPFDYGQNRRVYHGGSGGKSYIARSALTLPSGGKGGVHLGGMGVSPQGNIVVACINPANPAERSRMKEKKLQAENIGKPYTPQIYPGRAGSTNHRQEIHIFDIHGKLIKDDAAPGIAGCNDVEIDRDGNIHLLAAATPYIDGKPYFNGRGCTLLRFTPGRMKLLAAAKATIPLPQAERPKRSVDMTRPGLWVQGAQWMFGPVGADGHYGSGGRCHCRVMGWFSLDYFRRSFAPEVDRFRVVVLDAAGNVIMRIGRYGNVDDGMPLIDPDPALRGKQGYQPPNPRSIGGDEVAIMHAQGVAVQNDKRLFIADGGNQCIRSVKLDYHITASAIIKKR